MKHDNADFAGRRGAAKEAKAALLEKVKAKQNDPAAEARRSERAAILAARAEREAAKRKDMELKAREEAKRKQEEAEKAKQEEAERQAALEAQKAEDDAKKAAENTHVTRFLQDEAALKAARDARYAARQARKG